MSTRRDEGVAGYHIYVTVDPTRADTAGLGRRRGPLRDAAGAVVRAPLEVDVAQLAARLPVGTVELVPVDAAGTELPLAARTVEVPGNAAEATALATIYDEVLVGLRTHLADDPLLGAQLARVLADPAARGAVSVTLPTELAGRAFATLTPAERAEVVAHVVRRAVTQLADAVVQEVPLVLDRASVRLIDGTPAHAAVVMIEVAVARGDHAGAAVRALARYVAGLDVPVALVGQILVGLPVSDAWFALARQAGPALVPIARALVVEQGTARDQEGELQAVALAVVVQRQAPAAVAALVPRLRRLARLPWSSWGAISLLHWLVAQVGDAHLAAVCAAHQPAPVPGLAEAVLEGWDRPVVNALALLPEVDAPPPLPAVTVRRTATVGRNEPCPCGSGAKFKRCCADRPPPALDARLQRAAQLNALPSRVLEALIPALARADVALLDVTRLSPVGVVEVVRRQAQLRDWPRARAAVDELARRGGLDADGHWEDVVHEMVDARQYARAQAAFAQLAPDEPLALRVSLALEPSAPLARLEALAAQSLRGELAGPAFVDVAFALLATYPALGIAVARSVVVVGGGLDAQVLGEAIEEARDDLALPPEDAIHDLARRLGGAAPAAPAAVDAAAARAHLEAEAARLRAELATTTDRMQALATTVSAHERALGQAEAALAVATQRATATALSEGERRRLRDEVATLQAQIRDGNAERAALRQQAAAMATAPRAAAPAPAVAPEEGEDEFEAAAVAGQREVLMPEISAAVERSLRALPRAVAAEAMRTVGALAAGDAVAWRGVKQAKDLRPPLWMARLGIHHRLLCRQVERRLVVIDVVAREGLLTVLKHLRTG